MANRRLVPATSNDDDDEIDIYLKVRSTIAVKVKRSHTIKELKAMFCNKEGVSENLQEVFLAGEHLKDGLTLAEYGIQRNATLDIILNTAFARKLYIKVPSKLHSFVVVSKASDTIRHIKSILEDKVGMQSIYFTLMHEGKLLEEDRSLACINLPSESTLYLVSNPRDVLSISVHTSESGTITLEVKLLYTVGEVKALVGSMTGSIIEDGNLIYAGQSLEDSKTLAYYNIKEHSLLELLPIIQIFVKTWGGKTITLNVHPSDTAKDVNGKIFKKLGLPMCHHRLFLHDKCLEEDRTLASYCIQKHSTLYMGRPIVRTP
ncbi:hypothetical protein Ancab_040447 [Ancistrocladus abbreviatus]